MLARDYKHSIEGLAAYLCYIVLLVIDVYLLWAFIYHILAVLVRYVLLCSVCVLGGMPSMSACTCQSCIANDGIHRITFGLYL